MRKEQQEEKKKRYTRNGEAETRETKSTNELSPFFSTKLNKSRPRHGAAGTVVGTWFTEEGKLLQRMLHLFPS